LFDRNTLAKPDSSEQARGRRESAVELLHLLGAGAGLGMASAIRGEWHAAAEPLQAIGRTGTVAFPTAAVIRTVLKDVPPDTLGSAATLFHEHLSFEWARVRGPNARGNATGPDKDVALVSDQLNIAAAEGVGCIVADDRRGPRRRVSGSHCGADTRPHCRGGLPGAVSIRRMSPRNPTTRWPTIW
jgi:hypothetical protein